MSEIIETIKQLRSKHAALEDEKKLSLAAQRDCETKAREHSARYFACKAEQQAIAESLRTNNAALMEEQAVSAAQKAQQDAEAARTEATATLDQLKAQKAEMDAKLKEVNHVLSKAKEAEREE